MRNRQSLFLVILALVLVTISFVLISVWGYHFYYAKKNDNKTIAIQRPPAKDSVQAFVNSFSEEIVNEFDSTSFDSADRDLVVKIIEFQKLKNEISQILKERSASRDLPTANEKILQLQHDVEELKNKNDTIIRENERLNQMVKELMRKNHVAPAAEKRSSSKKILANSAYTLPVLVSHLRFNAFSLNDPTKPTNVAAKTERLSGSFQVNIKPFNKNLAIYVAIIQPNGKTLNPAGDAKIFTTKNGKRKYSTLLHFDNKKDNGARLAFSIDAHNFQKGKYVMQIFHQGVMIGRLTRTLF